jgi:hypothetical protein
MQASYNPLQLKGILRKNIFKIKKSIFRIVLAGTVLIATLLNPLSPGKAGFYLHRKKKKIKSGERKVWHHTFVSLWGWRVEKL